MNISLVGFSNTGKSTVGRLLAQQLGWALVDTDAEIERRTGRTIPEIFERDGERYLIGSKGGDDRHPEWYLNLVAQPRVHVRVMAEVYEADARTLDVAERAALWPDLVASYPMFDDYQRATARAIPVVQLHRR